ncbi:hypothetical protein ACWCQV_16825, partial [Streptomyces eurythermus]
RHRQLVQAEGDVRLEAGHRDPAEQVLIHGWDIGRALEPDPRLPAALVDACLELFDSRPRMFAQWGFAEVAVEPGADPQTRLLALAGRRP